VVVLCMVLHLCCHSASPLFCFFFFSAHDMHIFLQSRLILVLLFVKVYQNGGLHIGKEVSFSMLPCFGNLMAAKFCNIVIWMLFLCCWSIPSQGVRNMLSVVYQHTPVIALAKWLDYVVALIRCMFRRLLIAQAFMQKWFFFFSPVHEPSSYSLHMWWSLNYFYFPYFDFPDILGLLNSMMSIQENTR
jgi:hypothetical protein